MIIGVERCYLRIPLTYTLYVICLAIIVKVDMRVLACNRVRINRTHSEHFLFLGATCAILSLHKSCRSPASAPTCGGG